MTRALRLPLFLLTGCATVPAAPPMPPVEAPAASYRALGTEPFWALELTGREMLFTNADGLRIVEPQPRAIHGFAGDIYNAKRLGLNIVHGAGCSDGMSDRRYSDKVQVRVDDRSYEGCGGGEELSSTR